MAKQTVKKSKDIVFLWEGINKNGGKVKGEMGALNATLVRG